MSYESWLNTIIAQIDSYRDNKETDLVLLKNHLEMLANDIRGTEEYDKQLEKHLK